MSPWSALLGIKRPRTFQNLPVLLRWQWCENSGRHCIFQIVTQTTVLRSRSVKLFKRLFIERGGTRFIILRQFIYLLRITLPTFDFVLLQLTRAKEPKVSPFRSHLQRRPFNSYPLALIFKRRPVLVYIICSLRKSIYVSGIRICVYLRTTTQYATNHFFAGKQSTLEKKRAKLVEDAGLLDFQGANGRRPQLDEVINPLWCYLLRPSSWQRYYNSVSLLPITNQFLEGPQCTPLPLVLL